MDEWRLHWLEKDGDVTIDLRDPSQAARAVRDALGLSPHPEGGHYRELWRDRSTSGRRGAGTSILFLLAEGERSHWHRIDAAEIWLRGAGASLAGSLVRCVVAPAFEFAGFEMAPAGWSPPAG